MSKKQLFITLFIGATLCTLLWNYCTPVKASNPYKNVNNKEAKYVGINTCRNCHEDVYKTYIETGMGKSWDKATRQKSAANFDPAKAYVYDAKNDLHYKAFWVGDSLHFLEYRLFQGDTVHRREETIDYIVGSGQHTNSHIYEVNGYLHQAPITFYTQEGRWDLAPGYETYNDGFNRHIEAECITCHNGYSKKVEGSLHKYENVAVGIDCERCHGPGSLHVEAALAGKQADTSKGPDYTIVNPRRLSTDAQNNLCQRCHLQGVSVLNDGASFYDFFPSQQLGEHWNVFMPEYKNKTDHMIMASHVERMKMSACYTKSNQMSCITCHNPHISVKYTAQETYNKACINCHQANKGVACSQSIALRQANGDNCNQCHMKKNGSIDIPHVAVHDHYIRKNINEEESKLADGFVGLTCYNTDKPLSDLTKGRGFLEFFERFDPIPAMPDSAIYYLEKSGTQKGLQNKDLIRAYYLKKDFGSILQLAKDYEANEIKDYWNAYRIAEGYNNLAQPANALPFFKRAVALMPYNLDFINKLGECQLALNDIAGAEKTFQNLLQLFPKYAMAYSHLGFIEMQKGKFAAAEEQLLKAATYAPNNMQVKINLAVCKYRQGKTNEVRKILEVAHKLDINNAQINAMLADIKKAS